MVGRARTRHDPAAGLRDGHGVAVRDRGAAMAITAGGARWRAVIGPPGTRPRAGGDSAAQLRLRETPWRARAGGGKAVRLGEVPRRAKAVRLGLEEAWYAAVVRGGTRQGKAWQEDTPQPEQRTGAVCPHATASPANVQWQSAGVA
jgi:hypothetical protein